MAEREQRSGNDSGREKPANPGRSSNSGKSGNSGNQGGQGGQRGRGPHQGDRQGNDIQRRGQQNPQRDEERRMEEDTE